MEPRNQSHEKKREKKGENGGGDKSGKGHTGSKVQGAAPWACAIRPFKKKPARFHGVCRVVYVCTGLVMRPARVLPCTLPPSRTPTPPPETPIINEMELTFVILDSRRVLHPAPLVLGLMSGRTNSQIAKVGNIFKAQKG